MCSNAPLGPQLEEFIFGSPSKVSGSSVAQTAKSSKQNRSHRFGHSASLAKLLATGHLCSKRRRLACGRECCFSVILRCGMSMSDMFRRWSVHSANTLNPKPYLDDELCIAEHGQVRHMIGDSGGRLCTLCHCGSLCFNRSVGSANTAAIYVGCD